MLWAHTVGYKIVLFLHLASVVIGFGPWMLNGVFGRALGKGSDAETKAVGEPFLRISVASQFAMYGVFVFGGALIGMSDKAVKFSQAWVPISIVLWIACIGVLHGMILPSQRKILAGDGDRPALVQRMSVGVAVMNVLVLVVMVLMVFEPGNKLVR